MSVSIVTKSKIDSNPQEDLLKSEFLEVQKLEQLICSSLAEIEGLRLELKDLEGDLNHFLDQFYGSGASFFKSNSIDTPADNDNGINKVNDFNEAKKNIYNKIAKVCSQDIFSFCNNETHANLLSIEGYLADGSDTSRSPQDLLSDLIVEYYNLTQQIQDLKNKKQDLLQSPAYELKQDVMWTNIKTSETISSIKESLTHHVNRLS